jgi:hypothetical protein
VIGYGSRFECWEGREWEWLDAHRPDLEVRCAGTRQEIAHAWLTPEGVWYRSGTWQGAVGEMQSDHGTVTLLCPVHGMVLLPGQYLIDATEKERRRHVAVYCLDPGHRYTRP